MLRTVSSRPSHPTLAAELASLIAAIERWSVDLALSEEPARFLAALEGGVPGDGAPATGE